MRVSRTFQDSNVFGSKSRDKLTITDEVRNSHPRDVKVTPTFSSTVFEGAANHESEIAKEALRKYVVNHGEALFPDLQCQAGKFEPKYNQISATEKHIEQVYGERYKDFIPHRPTSRPQDLHTITNPGLSAADRAVLQHESHVFGQDTHYKDVQAIRASSPTNDERQRKGKYDARGSNSHKKKQDELNSNIFNENTENLSVATQVKLRESASKQALGFKDDTNEAARRRERNFSDILPFGASPSKPPIGVRGTPSKLLPTTVRWNDKGGVDSRRNSPLKQMESSKNNPLYHDVTYADQPFVYNPAKEDSPTIAGATKITDLQKERRTDIYDKLRPSMNELLSTPHLLNESTNMSPGRRRELKEDPVFILDITQMPNTFDQRLFQQLVHEHGVHVVDMKLEHERTASPEGKLSGKVNLRAADSQQIEEVKRVMETYGYKMTKHVDYNPIRSSAGKIKRDAEHFNYQEDGKYDPKNAYLKNLQSNGDLLGGGEASGQWKKPWKKNPIEEEEYNRKAFDLFKKESYLRSSGSSRPGSSMGSSKNLRMSNGQGWKQGMARSPPFLDLYIFALKCFNVILYSGLKQFSHHEVKLSFICTFPCGHQDCNFK
eukprot:TRINITY_DN2264_c0_g1_i11.p1 TRINITY_DN2264_c0_g1~~TRINITY_DN2264_c0_g1_i11.p1  ORF type:complete len:605 (+),score=41.02 TRINITY_DN2264_c0_g1_i11:177-1991(+)